jgi:hypothetical protein
MTSYVGRVGIEPTTYGLSRGFRFPRVSAKPRRNRNVGGTNRRGKSLPAEQSRAKPVTNPQSSALRKIGGGGAPHVAGYGASWSST